MCFSLFMYTTGEPNKMSSALVTNIVFWEKRLAEDVLKNKLKKESSLLINVEEK